jgi:parvulin-like peptidyl-prolyl isomerase
MQPAGSAVAATLGDTTLSLADMLTYLHQHMRLVPLLREAVIERFLIQHAEQAGLGVSVAELQQAANRFRERQALQSARDMHAWLARQQLSVDDFEASLECALLIAKFQDHVTHSQLAAHFASHREDYAKMSLRRIVVRHEDLARELLHQIQEEGEDFAGLACKHSVHASRAAGGASGWVRRRDLPASFAAAVVATAPGQAAGPFAAQDGFHLILVEAIVPALLDAPTTTMIRQELFEAWLAERLRTLPLTMPLLDARP